MKHVSLAEGQSQAMPQDPRLAEAIRTALRRFPIGAAVETGTYLGEGSTRLVADAIHAEGMAVPFATIENNLENWGYARRALRDRPFVECRLGLSVGYAEAFAFIKSDPAILYHEIYPDVYIDDLENPLRFYMRELESSGHVAEDLLRQLLVSYRERHPLVVLDSAGGIGWLEFKITLALFGEAPFVLLLDDTKHLKHFRSLAVVEGDPSTWEILAQDNTRGWVLAYKKEGAVAYA